MNLGGPEVLPWVGTGFKDTTRVGASPPAKWVEVVMDNAENLEADLGGLMEILGQMREILKTRDKKKMTELLETISAFRRLIESPTPKS
jgi:prephenate dehydrogenase